jgi:hypothetical protein
MRKRLVPILVLSTLVASTLVGCAGSSGQSSEQPCTLIVHSITGGDVSVMEEDTGGWIEAQVGMSLEPGDCIRCSGSSNAEITFIEGTTIELETGTEIEVASLDYSADTGSATIRLKQTIGSIVFRVTKIIDPASLYEVETPAGVVAVRGSAVQITVIEDGTTWACNLEGDIWAIAQGVELQVPEGRCCVIRPGQPPRLICDLTISSSGGGSVIIPGEGTFPYDEGTVVDLVAEAEEGYHFINWTGDVSTVANISATTTTITMNDNYSITANFEEIPLGQFGLTISSTSGGSVTVPGEGTFAYDEGTVVNLVASPASGYDFLKWGGDVGTIANVNSPSTTIAMHGDYSISADFVRQYNLTISSTTGGSVTTPGEGTFIYNAGTVVNLVAAASSCYDFLNWTGSVGTIANVNAASTTITMNGDYSITASFEEGEVVTFPDPNLETAIRAAIAKPTGPICKSDLKGLTVLSVKAQDPVINDLSGLEHCTSLEYLSLQDMNVSDISPLASLTSLWNLYITEGGISDISPLANLTNLTHLWLMSQQVSDLSPLANLTSLTTLHLLGQQISDISPLANLTNLTSLGLTGNQISDISPLANLTNLTSLGLANNQISDISPLTNLTNLIGLFLTNNQIGDISPLAYLINLSNLCIGWNQISDISPLVANTGLSAGDTVDLRVNPLSPDSINIYIPQLQARGVTVTY